MSEPTASAASASPAAAAANAAAAHSSSALNTDTNIQPLITMYNNRPSVKEQYSRVHTEFLDQHRDLAKAKSGLSKFKEKCNLNGVFRSLPKAISLDVVSRLRLPAVFNMPDYWKSTEEAVQKIEHDAGEQIYNTVLAAKVKHLAHLQQQSTPAIFIAASLKRFSESTREFATVFQKTMSLPFPSDACIALFDAHVRSVVLADAMNSIDTVIAQEQHAEALKKADHIAQQAVLAGAHDGNNIRTIAAEAARNFVLQHERQQRNQQKQAAPVTVSSLTASSHHPKTVATAPGHRSDMSGQRSANVKSVPRNDGRHQPSAQRPTSPQRLNNRKRKHTQPAEQDNDDRMTDGEDSAQPTRHHLNVTAPKNRGGATERRTVTTAPNQQQRHKKPKLTHQPSSFMQAKRGNSNKK
jgi:hypothetical protein